MKYIYAIFCFFLLTNCTSQKNITVNQKLDSSKGKEIVLFKITNDSRCPEGTQCIWAGEVSFEVVAYDNGNVVNKAQFTLNLEGQTEIISWFKKHLPENKKALKSIGILPYPKDGVVTKKEDYFIQLNYK